MRNAIFPLAIYIKLFILFDNTTILLYICVQIFANLLHYTFIDYTFPQPSNNEISQDMAEF